MLAFWECTLSTLPIPIKNDTSVRIATPKCGSFEKPANEKPATPWALRHLLSTSIFLPDMGLSPRQLFKQENAPANGLAAGRGTGSYSKKTSTRQQLASKTWPIKKKLGRSNDAPKGNFLSSPRLHTSGKTNMEPENAPEFKRKHIYKTNHQFLVFQPLIFRDPCIVCSPGRFDSVWNFRTWNGFVPSSPACHPDWCEALLGQSILPWTEILGLLRCFFWRNKGSQKKTGNDEWPKFLWKMHIHWNQDLLRGIFFSRLVDRTQRCCSKKKSRKSYLNRLSCGKSFSSTQLGEIPNFHSQLMNVAPSYHWFSHFSHIKYQLVMSNTVLIYTLKYNAHYFYIENNNYMEIHTYTVYILTDKWKSWVGWVVTV